MNKTTIVLIGVLGLAGCGEVDSVSTAPPPDGTGAAGSTTGAMAAAGASVAGADASGVAGAVAGTAGAAGAAAVCAPPSLAVSWTITDLGTLQPMTCEQLGVSSFAIRITSISGTPPFLVEVPCTGGVTSGAVSLTGLPNTARFFLYDLIVNSPSFNDQRAAWARPPGDASSAGSASFDATKCGTDAATVGSAAPIQIVVGMPPSCDPCTKADKCCAGGPGGAVPMNNICPAPGQFACEGLYGVDRTAALLACTDFTAEFASSSPDCK